VTAWAALIVTVQVPVPVQPPPPQPLKVEPAAGVAVKVTAVPLANAAEQVAPQEMPVGALETVPVPVPALVTASVKGCSVNAAVTEVAALTVTVQVPVPVQPPPLQPVNVEPAAGVAVKVTAVPLVNAVEQVAPQEMPAGALVTLPLPVPEFVTLRVKDDCTKLAVTVWAALIVTVHVPVPVQPPPLQPLNVEPAAGVAVKVTAVPLANPAEQVVPQEMPVGALVTVPPPAPALLTVSVKLCWANVAVTAWAALIVTVHVPVPVQPPPLQPVNVEPAAGVAVKVTAAPVVKDAEHVVPHEIPAGLLDTVPVPAPDLETVRVELTDVPVPVTRRDSVSPSAVKLTLVLAAAVMVGVNRTVTVAVAPDPTSVNGLPETMLKGADTDAVPVMVPLRVLCTVNVCVAELPMLTLPNAVVPVGVTAISTCATAEATPEHVLSLPLVSTAVTATL
jgi:hypothetical protein